LYIAQYLKQHYSIPTNPLTLPFLSENEDLVEAFLFKHKGGYPDHFSTALTVMLRSINIPARLVAGFAPGEFNPFTGLYVVRNTDAYAMTEVYFPNSGGSPLIRFLVIH
jgi:transglutaminase-like putative cysteine protease